MISICSEYPICEEKICHWLTDLIDKPAVQSQVKLMRNDFISTCISEMSENSSFRQLERGGHFRFPKSEFRNLKF